MSSQSVFGNPRRSAGSRLFYAATDSRGSAARSLHRWAFCTLVSRLNVDVGQIIAGKYELVRLLGKGAMGEVWLATHNSLGGEFAIKLVEPADDIEAETAAGRFQLEAQIAAKLSRKTRHIVSVSDHGEEDGLAYLVMELLEGESLEQRTKRGGALEMPEVAAIVLQVARALSLAHEEGIFHRDLKPANVWLGKDEDGRLLVKLLDFGIARSAKPFRTRSPFATSKDMVLGTPSYMSPEQARGLDSLDYRCDLWALAVVAYEALTKKIPFEGETVEDIFLSICTFRVVPALARRPDLPPSIEAFFARAFAPKLEDRFANAAELSDAFERLVPADALESALGIVLTPSARRLEVARQSQPNVAAPSSTAQPQMQVPTPPAMVMGPPTPPQAFPPSGPVGAQVGLGPLSSPDLNVASGTPTVITRRQVGGGLLIGAVALLVLLGIGVIGFVALRGGGDKTAGKQPDSAPSSIVTTTTATAPTSDLAIPPPPPTTTAPTTASEPHTTTASVKPDTTPRAKPPATGVTPPPPPTLVPQPAPQPHPTLAPATTKSAAPAKSGGRSDVF